LLSRLLVNDLALRHADLTVIEEAPESKLAILRRRARLLGWVTAVGQAACTPVLRLLGRKGMRRVQSVMAEHGLNSGPLRAGIEVRHVASVNSAECRRALDELAPAVVVVYGTRIIRGETLAALADVPVINYHAGINPKYRGQNPAYWALVKGDAANAGVTIHLVDAGVDTGRILYQSRVSFSREDTIVTQPYVQMAAALPLLARAIDDALAGQLRPMQVDLPSRQWFPPTVWSYLWHGMAHGVW
jgi:methionyl-tRNA formyltransferase